MTRSDELQLATELEQFLIDQFPATARHGVPHDLDLFDEGVVDSVGVAETLAHIEEHYNVEIPDEVLLSDDFTTISGMARSILALRTPAAVES